MVVDTASTNGTDVIVGAREVNVGMMRRCFAVPRGIPFTLRLAQSLVEVS